MTADDLQAAALERELNAPRSDIQGVGVGGGEGKTARGNGGVFDPPVQAYVPQTANCNSQIKQATPPLGSPQFSTSDTPSGGSAISDEDDGPPEGYSYKSDNPLMRTAGPPVREGHKPRRAVGLGEPPRKRGRPLKDPEDRTAALVDVVVSDEDIALLEKGAEEKRAWAQSLLKQKEMRKRLLDAREANGVPALGRAGPVKSYQLNIRDMIEMALSELGGVKWLVKQAERNPQAFFTLLGKTMPLQVAADRASPTGGAVEHVIVFRQNGDVIDV